MAVNADKPQLWKADIAQSIDQYNTWFMQSAPHVYRTTRIETTRQVAIILQQTQNLTQITPQLLGQHPEILPMLRMVTAPPLARDRLIGLAGVSANLVESMEKVGRLPSRMEQQKALQELTRIGAIILQLVDTDLFPWLASGQIPTEIEIMRASSVIADRWCGAAADPLVRNAQEQRQLALLRGWLEARGYHYATPMESNFAEIDPGSFCFHYNVPGALENRSRINITVDVLLKPLQAKAEQLPLLLEAKSAGDFTNTNKRRKEEGSKIAQLRRLHGPSIQLILFLCGYFDTPYLGYEAAEGIDWLWEHRIDDLSLFGV